MQKAANAVMVKGSWLSSNSSLEKTTAPSSGDKWAVTVLGLASLKEASQERNSYHREKIGHLDQRLLQWELNREPPDYNNQWELNKEPPDYNNQSHLKRVGIIKGPLQLF